MQSAFIVIIISLSFHRRNYYVIYPALTLKFILTLSEYIGFYFLILLYQRNLI